MAVTTNQPKSANNKILKTTFKPFKLSLFEVKNLSKTPIKISIIRGSVGKLKLTVLYLSSIK
jgi:hypothetical protein